jgi:Zn-dependent protease with chaperone function
LTRRLAALALFAVVWTAAVFLLWRSSVVPSSLRLPHVDVHDYFTDTELRAAERFGRVETPLYYLSLLLPLAALAVYARYGTRWARESAAGPLGTGMLLGMLGFALVWVVSLPAGVVELWWDRRHHLVRVGYAEYLFGDWLGLGGQFVFLCLALAIVMGLARRLPRTWWLPASGVFVLLGVLFTFVSPYLISTHRLRNPALRSTAARLERLEHVGHVPVVVEKMHDATSLPNAEAVGIWKSRHVVLWDTLIDGRFTPGELKVVIAHELGHLARHHLWKGIAWFALFAVPGTYLIARATRRRGGMGEPAAVPLALLVLVGLQLLALPLENAISRHIEAEADWMALRTTRDPQDAVGLFHRFSTTSLEEPNPSTLDYLLVENHPTLAQRIAMAKAYATWAAQSP